MLQYITNRIIKKLRFSAIKNSTLSKDTKIESGTTFIDSFIDRHSFVGYDCSINNTRIGPFCSIASNVNIGGAAHPVKYLSTSPVFLSHRDSVKAKYSFHKYKHIPETVIGADVWIGQGAYIKSGVNVGHGAVIGMGAVVTKDVKPYEIVGGNPAKHLKYRFDKKVILALLDMKWWDFSEKELFEIGPFVTQPEQLLRMKGLL